MSLTENFVQKLVCLTNHELQISQSCVGSWKSSCKKYSRQYTWAI